MSILGGIINAFDGSGDTVIVIPATSAAVYEPYYLLSQIKTVDGSGSNLDADLLDGYHATHFGTATQIQTLQNVDVSLQSQINNLFAIGSRLIYRENFTGNGTSTNFVLTGALQNAGYTTGSWSAANVLTALQADVTDLDGKPIFDSVIPIYRDRINVSTIDSFGNVTLDHIPQAGQQFSIWYWYQLTSSDVLSYYYREDHVAEMEADGVQTASQVDVFTSSFGNMVLRTTDNTVQKALDRLDDYLETQSMSGSEDMRLRAEVIAISGDLQAQINSINVVGGINVSVVEGPVNTFTISVSGIIGGGTGDITWAEVALVTGGLQNQIDAIVEESTTISSSGASILVTQNGNNFNLEVASAPVSNHNSLLGLQGSGSDYYHLNATQFASISGGVDLSAYTLLSTTASISGDLQAQINALGSGGVTSIEGLTGVVDISGGSNITISTIGNSVVISSTGGAAATNLDALTDVTLTAPVSGNIITYDGSGWVNKKNYRFITATYDGAGSDIDLNKVVVARVPYNGIIESWNIWSTTAAISGSVDVWKATTIPTVSDKISATNPLQLINQSTNSGTPTGWTTSTITDGDYIAFNTTAISGCNFLSLTLKVETY